MRPYFIYYHSCKVLNKGTSGIVNKKQVVALAKWYAVDIDMKSTTNYFVFLYTYLITLW